MKQEVVAACLVSALTVGAPGASSAAPSRGGRVVGLVTGLDETPGRDHSVRVRNLDTGAVVGFVSVGPSGQFSVTGLPAGTYLVEAVAPDGPVVGVSSSFVVAEGASVSATVSAAQSNRQQTEEELRRRKLVRLWFAGAAAVTAAGIVYIVQTGPDASSSR